MTDRTEEIRKFWKDGDAHFSAKEVGHLLSEVDRLKAETDRFLATIMQLETKIEDQELDQAQAGQREKWVQKP